MSLLCSTWLNHSSFLMHFFGSTVACTASIYLHPRPLRACAELRRSSSRRGEAPCNSILTSTKHWRQRSILVCPTAAKVRDIEVILHTIARVDVDSSSNATYISGTPNLVCRGHKTNALYVSLVLIGCSEISLGTGKKHTAMHNNFSACPLCLPPH